MDQVKNEVSTKTTGCILDRSLHWCRDNHCLEDQLPGSAVVEVKHFKQPQYDDRANVLPGAHRLLAIIQTNSRIRKNLKNMMIALLIVCALVFAYLMYALIRPEKF